MNDGWRDLGDSIQDLIQDAINSKNFERLNQSVRNTIDDTLNQMFSKTSGSTWQSRREYTEYRSSSGEQHQEQHREQRVHSVVTTPVANEKPVRRSRIFGSIKSIFGYILTGTSSFTLALLLAVGFSVGFADIWIADLFILPFLGLGIGLAVGGGRQRARSRRFRSYLERLRGKTYCELTTMAEAVKKNKSFVTKDLRWMIQEGWFNEGHIDDEETCFIADHATYNQYLITKSGIEKRRREEAEQQAANNNRNSGLDAEVLSVIEEGEAYIERLKRCNDRIPGEEISAKISRMEIIVQKIFDRVRSHPKNVHDIHKLMEYYLPMTIKLLEAYEDLDRQSFSGENIDNSKKEIEDTLDTLNIAFENMFDGMFQKTAWDVSTDISVLKSLLAQEGLTDDGFNDTKA